MILRMMSCRDQHTNPRVGALIQRYWNGAGGEALEIKDTFSNQALNTLYNFGCRGLIHAVNVAELPPSIQGGLQTAVTVDVLPATDIRESADLWIYDPPYADAVHYHEITEYFIAWLRKDPPAPFNRWRWDSRRPLAIQGKGEKFRANMVDALQAMVTRMPANGLQGLWCSMRLTRHVAPRTGTAFGSRISYSTS
jgi:putative DNA methylase